MSSPSGRRRRRVAHVITVLGTGGAEITLAKVVSGLADRWEAAIFSLTVAGWPGPELAAGGVEVTALRWPRGRLHARGFVRLARALARFAPDLVQGWMLHGNLAAWAAARCMRLAVPVAWNVRYTPADLRREKVSAAGLVRLGALLSRRPEAVIFNAQAALERHLGLGYAPARAELIPNGFDTRRFRPDEGARQAVRAELGLEAAAVLVGLVGRWDPLKGHATFLEAVAMLGSSRPGVAFVLAGPGVDGANEELAGQVAALGLGPSLCLLGERRDVPRLMAALDVACLASLGEGFPNVVGEAMACGVPAVVTDVGDAARLVGETGIVVAPANAAALAAGLRRALALPVEERRRLGAAARERIIGEFSLEAMLGRYDRLWCELLAAGHGEG